MGRSLFINYGHAFTRWWERFGEDHPEYFALYDGARRPAGNADRVKMCVAEPALWDAVIDNWKAKWEENPVAYQTLNACENDGGGFCECPDCTAQDTGQVDPFSGEVSITDRFLRFANAVAAQVHDVYPDIRFAFYAYHSYMLQPREVMPDPSIVPAIAPIELCRLHGMGNSVCPERNFHQHLISEWTKLSPEVYHRGYSYNLAGPNLPLNYVSRWGYEIPYCERAGITGMRIETQMSWANYGPLGYVMAQLMWDSEQDLEALMETRGSLIEPTYTLKQFVINSGSGITATAAVKLTRDRKDHEDVSTGDGPVDAAFNAIERITGISFTLEEYVIHAVTAGKDAQGEVSVRVSRNGRTYKGRGVSTDVIGASIKAYLFAVNSMLFEESYEH